jgi:hypothetical protein
MNRNLADIPVVVDKILKQVRLFRDHSKSKSSIITQIAKNPNSINTDELQGHVKEGTDIVKDMFELIDELDSLEGKVL